MGVITGIGGLVQGVDRFQEFSVDATADLKEIMDAGTGGSMRRITGTRGWDATYMAGGIVPDHYPGEIISFLGSIDGSVGLSGQALITQVQITIPVSTNDPITNETTLYGLDDIAAGAAVITPPDPPVKPDMPKGICVQLSDPIAVPVFNDEENTTNIVITLLINPAEYIDCSTDGNRSAVEGTWDATLEWERNVDDFSLLPTRGNPYIARVPVDDVGATFYQFDYMRIGEHSNMQVNRNGDLVSAGVNGAYSHVEDVGGTETPGQILLPGGGAWNP